MPKIIRVGDAAGIELPEDVMEALGLAIGDEIEVTVSDGVLEVQPVVRRPRLRPEVGRAYGQTIEKFGDALKRLAD